MIGNVWMIAKFEDFSKENSSLLSGNTFSKTCEIGEGVSGCQVQISIILSVLGDSRAWQELVQAVSA